MGFLIGKTLHLFHVIREIEDVESRQVCEGMQARARGLHARVDDAPGRPVSAGVPRDPREAHLPRDVQDAGGRRRGDDPAGAALRDRRGHHLRRHPAPARTHGHRPRVRQGRRPGDPQPRALPGGRAEAQAHRRGNADRISHEGHQDRSEGARRQGAAHRVLRRALHPGTLHDRGRRIAELRACQGHDVRGAQGLAQAHGAPDRRHHQLPERPDRRGRAGGRSSSTPGSAPSGRAITASSCCRTRRT